MKKINVDRWTDMRIAWFSMCFRGSEGNKTLSIPRVAPSLIIYLHPILGLAKSGLDFLFHNCNIWSAKIKPKKKNVLGNTMSPFSIVLAFICNDTFDFKSLKLLSKNSYSQGCFSLLRVWRNSLKVQTESFPFAYF